MQCKFHDRLLFIDFSKIFRAWIRAVIKLFWSCAYCAAARKVQGGDSGDGGVTVNVPMARIVELMLIGRFRSKLRS